MANLSDRFSMEDLQAAIRAMEAVGGGLATWYDAVRYDADPLSCSFQLYWRRGVLGKEPIAIGTDGTLLGHVRFYLLHNTQRPWARLEVRQTPGQVERGHFALMERRGFRCPDAAAGTAAVRALGYSAEDVELLMSWVEETTLAYLCTHDEEMARLVASIVQVGALGQGSPEEVVALLGSFAQEAKRKAMCGDPNGRWQANAWDKLADQWKRR